MTTPTPTEASPIAAVPPPAEAPAAAGAPAAADDADEATVAPKVPPKTSTALDIAFCCDCTGSMGAYIRSAQQNIRAIVQTLHEKKGGTCDIRFALVAYRDHPPQDRTYVTTVFPFTRRIEVMQSNVDFMSAQGGGDGPEAVAAALHEVAELEWSPNASKVVVWIADAPPHGLGEKGDGFPEGCPDGHDPLKILREMAAQGIALYAVGVEPILSTQYQYARDFMIAAAETMGGKFLPLGQAGTLADVIVGTALEGMELEQLWQETEEAIKREAAQKGVKLSEGDLLGQLETRMKEAAMHRKVRHVHVENPYLDSRYDRHNVVAFGAAPTLQYARGGRGGGRGGLRGGTNAHVRSETAAYNWHAQRAEVRDDVASTEQLNRAFGRGMKRMHRAE